MPINKPYNNFITTDNYLAKLKNALAAIFLIWPLGSLFLSFQYRKFSWSKNFFWLFCIYFGFTFIIANQEQDSARDVQTLVGFHDSGMSFSELVASLYSSKTDYADIVHPILTWLISVFTDSSTALLTIFAVVFGFFYSRNLWYIQTKISGNISLFVLIFIVTFALLNPIWNINGFRMWTAAQVFIYGLMPYLYEGRKNKLWWTVSAIFFHFSFILPLSILALYIVLRNRINLYFIVFIITTFISEINLEFVRGLFDYLPGFMQSRVSYTDFSYVQSLREASQDLNWYVPLSGKVIRWIIYAFVIVIFFQEKKTLIAKPMLLNLFCFGMWIYSWSNLARLIPSGGRFEIVSSMVMIFFITLFINQTEANHPALLRILKYSSLPALMLFILVSFRIGCDMFGPCTVLGNPIIALIYEDKTVIIDFVKSFL